MSRFNLKLVKSDLTAQENFKQLFEETNPQVFDEYTFGLPTPNPDHEKGLFPDPEKLKNRNTLITGTLKESSIFQGTTNTLSKVFEYDRTVPLADPIDYWNEVSQSKTAKLDNRFWVNGTTTTVADVLAMLSVVGGKVLTSDVTFKGVRDGADGAVTLGLNDVITYITDSRDTPLTIVANENSLVYIEEKTIKLRVDAYFKRFKNLVIDPAVTQYATPGPQVTSWFNTDNDITIDDAYEVDSRFSIQPENINGTFDYYDSFLDTSVTLNFGHVVDWTPAVLDDITVHELMRFYLNGIWFVDGGKSGQQWQPMFRMSDDIGEGDYTPIPSALTVGDSDYLTNIIGGGFFKASKSCLDLLMEIMLISANNLGINILWANIPRDIVPSLSEVKWEWRKDGMVSFDEIDYVSLFAEHPNEIASINYLVPNSITISDHLKRLVRNTSGLTVWGQYGIKGKLYCNPYSGFDNMQVYVDWDSKPAIKLEAPTLFNLLQDPNTATKMAIYEIAVMLGLPMNCFNVAINATGDKLTEILAYATYDDVVDKSYFENKDYPVSDLDVKLTLTMTADSIFYKDGDKVDMMVTSVLRNVKDV